ncbi:actin-related protein 2/3 complex subunit 2B-like [Olea europaea var. sylvestris]|uniref:actin-related protein 2/3 complex subunit 2B-like n=1 Tax=Olea europaea var. sylvestris TaxID=158386 RepID=UPI000C1D40BF|nr:actin-related protein 2/3 complex subunit 2B-like [Olea europaea var. sylvestris]
MACIERASPALKEILLEIYRYEQNNDYILDADLFCWNLFSPVSTKIIAEISSVQAVVLSSQLKEMLRNVESQEISQGRYKPIKLIYHPGELFYVIKQPAKITAVFPMRLKEKADVIIATAFFQELVVVRSTGACAKAPHYIWLPIPPPELREPIEDLSTNGGFLSLDITFHLMEGKKLDKTVWNLLKFYTFVKYHVKVMHIHKL